MKAVLSICVAVAFLLSVGCSSDPTAGDFEAFAQAYAEKATRAWPSKYGEDRQVKATLKTHDLRKTDSLTSPFVGSAVYNVEVGNVTIRHPRIDGYETPAVYHCLSVITFEWSEGQFKPIGGEADIVAIDTPSLSDEQRGRLGSSWTNAEPYSIPEKDLVDAKIGIVNGWGMTTLQEIKDVLEPAKR